MKIVCVTQQWDMGGWWGDLSSCCDAWSEGAMRWGQGRIKNQWVNTHAKVRPPSSWPITRGCTTLRINRLPRSSQHNHQINQLISKADCGKLGALMSVCQESTTHFRNSEWQRGRHACMFTQYLAQPSNMVGPSTTDSVGMMVQDINNSYAHVSQLCNGINVWGIFGLNQSKSVKIFVFPSPASYMLRSVGFLY